jgi:hypothetical protein
MPDFVSTPPPKKQRIPIPTIANLVSALVEYLPTRYDFQYRGVGLWPEREYGMCKTTLKLYDKRRTDKAAIEIDIDGKFAQTESARLWADPFLLTGYVIPFSEPPNLPVTELQKFFAQRTYIGMLVTPRADRSLAFRAVKHWDRGWAIFED